MTIDLAEMQLEKLKPLQLQLIALVKTANSALYWVIDDL